MTAPTIVPCTKYFWMNGYTQMMGTAAKMILTVGEQVGFRSMSSFNRHFAEAMGCSPSEWRRTVGAGRSTSILKYNGWLTPPRDK